MKTAIQFICNVNFRIDFLTGIWLFQVIYLTNDDDLNLTYSTCFQTLYYFSDFVFFLELQNFHLNRLHNFIIYLFISYFTKLLKYVEISSKSVVGRWKV